MYIYTCRKDELPKIACFYLYVVQYLRNIEYLMGQKIKTIEYFKVCTHQATFISFCFVIFTKETGWTLTQYRQYQLL